MNKFFYRCKLCGVKYEMAVPEGWDNIAMAFRMGNKTDAIHLCGEERYGIAEILGVTVPIPEGNKENANPP